MKRNIRHILWAAVLPLAFVSCSQDDSADIKGEPLPQGEYPIELVAGGLQMVANPAQASTRATVDDDWNGVGIVAVQVGNDVKPYAVAPSADGMTAKLSSDDPFWWERTDEAKTVTAWHPYNDACPTDWKVKADQSTAENYRASDLVKGELKDLSFADRNDPSKNRMTFSHQTAKVVVNLVAGDGVTLEADASVKLLNIEGADNGSTITSCRPAADTYTYLALLNGQEISADTPFIQVTTGDNTFLYKPQASKTLQAGIAYTYNITVKANGIEVTEATGGEWTDGGSEEVSSMDVIIYTASDLKLGDYYYSDGTWSDGGLRKLYSDGTTKCAETVTQPISGKTCIGIVFYTGRHETDLSDYSKPLTENGPTIPNGVFHGYVVALTDVYNDDNDRIRWEYGPNGEYDKAVGTSTSTDDWNGYSNSQKSHEFVKNNDGWEMKHFPAALASETYGNRTIDQDGNPTNAYDWQKPLAAPSNTSGWFLPSCGQLLYLYENSSLLSSRMVDVKNSAPDNCNYKDKIKWFKTSSNVFYYYWSSTESSRGPDRTWLVYFGRGSYDYLYKYRTLDVRSVLAF